LVLETFPIWRANIRGIGPVKVVALLSYGIDTAADVVIGRIVNVPGFGEVSAQPLPPEIQEVHRIQQNCASQAAQFRIMPLKGASELKRATATLLAKAKAHDPAINRAHAELEQARADLIYLGLPLPKVIARAAPLPAVH